jgi:diketogulonate reductase-like aldo/keto reductase
MSESSKTLKLNNGLEIPIMGLGTTRLRNLDDANKSLKDDDRMKDVEDSVYYSIKHGVRLIDTASKYENEVEVGKGIKKAIDEGIVKREDLFVITKMWLDEKDDPEKALKQSLERLQLSYVDLFLDHWPSGKCYNGKNNVKFISIKDIWPKMEKLVEENLTKSIGVSNYNVQNLLIVLSICKIKPVVNEVEFHPYLYQKDLKEFCDLENIKIIAYYPLIKGVNYKSRFPKIMNEKKLDLLNEEIVKKLSEKYSKTVGQIILNWHIHLGVIPIPGTASIERMKENLDAIDFKMEENDYDLISSLDKKFRFCDGFGIYGVDIFA